MSALTEMSEKSEIFKISEESDMSGKYWLARSNIFELTIWIGLDFCNISDISDI